jgi:hypothetical protein
MQHKLITTENYLLVVDDLEIKENNYVYVEGHVKPQMCKGFENNGDVLCYNNLPYIKEKTKKVISHLPLNNSPILEGVDLLPPLEDEVDKLAEEWNDKGEFTSPYSFKAGYNEAREKYKYTEEDMKKAMLKYGEWIMSNLSSKEYIKDSNNQTVYEHIIQSLQQPKIPVGFKCEINNPMFALSLQPQITTNPQGLTQWVGEYIY